MNEILDKARQEMDDVLSLIGEDLKGVKTGRAKPSLVENIKIKVESYDSVLTLKELASISAPSPDMLIISPWDKNISIDIEKGISLAGLNLSPVREGEIIRIKIPPLTEETRRDLVKLVGQKIESSRRLLRQVRSESKNKIEAMKGQPNVSEDDIFNWTEELQKLTDEFNSKIDQLGEVKEKELMEI